MMNLLTTPEAVAAETAYRGERGRVRPISPTDPGATWATGPATATTRAGLLARLAGLRRPRGEGAPAATPGTGTTPARSRHA